MTQRLKILLGVLGLLLAAVLWNRFSEAGSAPAAGAAEARQAGVRRAAAGRRGREAPAATAVVELRVGDLDVAGGEYRQGRNPFSFHSPPPPPPPPPRGPTPEELEARRRAEEEARQRAAELAAQRAVPAKPQPPAIDFAFLGTFGPQRRRIAVFLKDDDTIVNALVGDVIDGKFRLVSIGLESVDIEFVGFPDVPPAQLPVG